MTDRRRVSRVVIDLAATLLPYAALATIAFGLLTDRRGLMWTGCVVLGCVAVLAILGGLGLGIAIPLEIRRRWGAMNASQRILHGAIAVVISISLIVLCIVTGILVSQRT
jgi:hypothetical protein